ncbi:hypothetical protein [Acinetobacter sp. ANC 3832]|uniref:hypothetical protein n=1 Tax=Acinetobacter sp. ANC 3832 TaxID=1977874 RepID=UPI000A32B6BA|nr:hypothetical protein [Acinetobacter sp. ANC 3832]OTG95522.1 hypothetical protein B9T35_03000 [Acinetobacter sp. ANC 3832]
MHKLLIKMLFVITTIFIIIPLSNAKNTVPQFSEYPVKSVYTGTTARLDISDPDARMFRTRLNDALQQKADFAGEYVTTMWGCGASCRMYSFVNKRTGKLLQAGFGGEENSEDVIATNPWSRLLVTQEEHMDQNYAVESLTVRFYVLENGELKLIKTTKKAVTQEKN